jgi:hypothetical protein
MLWFRSDEVYSIQHYVIRFVSDLRQVGGFLRVLRFPPPIKLTAVRYNWNIVESGVKHYNPNPANCILNNNNVLKVLYYRNTTSQRTSLVSDLLNI